MMNPDETFGERVARLCDERGVPKNRIKTAAGTAVANLDRSKSVSLKAAQGIAAALGMSLWEIDAPLLYTTTTRELIDAGLLREDEP
jgi:uncharacterized protein (UPF0147 family)